MRVLSDAGRARVVAIALTASLGALAVLVQTPAAQQARTDAQERARLLQLQRDAVAQAQQAARPGAAEDQVRGALLNASRTVQQLGQSARLDAPLRADLARAASALAALPSRDTPRVASAISSVLALLDKARQQLESDGVLGLAFQGSYSQTKPKDPAYGGHASSMGPAPANAPNPEDGAPVPVTFEVGARVPSKMYCGGATEGTTPHTGGGRGAA